MGSQKQLTMRQMLQKKYDLLPFQGEWKEAFSEPESTGVWFIWGHSGNGKSSFVAQLCKELSRFGRIAVNSLEQGFGYTLQKNIIESGLSEAGNRVIFVREPMEDLSTRLAKPRSPYCAIIDSFQYAEMSFSQYKAFKEAHSNKLIIFVSHADGKMPEGRTARKVMSDADMKIWVEGFKAVTKGRFIGPSGIYTIWNGGAERMWNNGKSKNEAGTNEETNVQSHLQAEKEIPES